jgi:hypothetical protein
MMFRVSSLMMEAVRTSETSVDNHFTRQYIPEDNSEHHYHSVFSSIFNILNIVKEVLVCLSVCLFVCLVTSGAPVRTRAVRHGSLVLQSISY